MTGCMRNEKCESGARRFVLLLPMYDDSSALGQRATRNNVVKMNNK